MLLSLSWHTVRYRKVVNDSKPVEIMQEKYSAQPPRKLSDKGMIRFEGQ